MTDDEHRCARKHTSSRYAFTNRSANGAAMNRKQRRTMTRTKHIYEVRPRKDKCGVDLTSDVLPFGRVVYGEPNAIGNAIGYADHFSRSHHAVIRVYDAAGNVIETQRAQGRPQRLVSGRAKSSAFLTFSGLLYTFS